MAPFKNFGAKVLKVATLPYLPFVDHINDSSNKVIGYTGSLIEMLNVLTKTFNFTYTVVEPLDDKYGALTENGTWNGLIGMLVNREADIAAAALTVTHPRSQVVEFSSQFHDESIGILLRIQAKHDAVFRFVLNFSRYAWILTIILTLLSVIVVRMHHYFYPLQNDGVGKSLGSSGWFVFSTLVNQKTIIHEKTWGGRTFQLFWRVVCLMLCMFYISGLVAALTTSRFSTPFKDFDGLMESVDNGDYKICIEDSSALHATIMSGSSFVRLKTFLDSNPECVVNLDQCHEKFLTEPRFAYIGEVSDLENIQRDYSCTNSDKLILLYDRILPGFFGFAFQKNSPYVDAISRKVVEFNENGLMPFWKKRYTPRSKCATKSADDDAYQISMESLNLYEMAGVFVLLVVGLSLSALTLFVELKAFSRKTKKLEMIIRLK